MLPVWAKLAKDFEAAHPGVKINITPLENEAFKAKLTTVTQAGNPPDLFHSWGGGVLEQQVDAGLVKELSGDVSVVARQRLPPTACKLYQVDGKHVRRAVRHRHGRLLVQQGALRQGRHHRAADDLGGAARRRPEAEGRRHHPDRAGRQGQVARRTSTGPTSRCASAGVAALQQAGQDRRLRRRPTSSTAGAKLKELVDLAAVPEGLPRGRSTGHRDGQAAIMGNGQAAMELMGQWAPIDRRPPTRRTRRASATSSASSRSRRSTAARARRPRCSAAATASPSARTRRRRRSTS